MRTCDDDDVDGAFACTYVLGREEACVRACDDDDDGVDEDVIPATFPCTIELGIEPCVRACDDDDAPADTFACPDDEPG